MMEPGHSFRRYGKVNSIDEREQRRRSQKRHTAIAVSLILILFVVGAAAIAVAMSRGRYSKELHPPRPTGRRPPDPVRALCNVTLYPDTCYSSISSVIGMNRTDDPELLFRVSLRIAIDGVYKVAALPARILVGVRDGRVEAALRICAELIADSAEQLNESLALMDAGGGPSGGVPSRSKIDDLRTWISAAITDMDTCLDGFENTSGHYRRTVESVLRNSTELVSNGLAIVTRVLGVPEKFDEPRHRKLLATGSALLPGWVTADSYRRRLLQNLSQPWVTPDVIVAKDGSGRFMTIAAALAVVPKRSSKPFVIRVKKGTYLERVVVDKAMWNVAMVGDGMDKTIVSGNSGFADGTPTFDTASFVVDGRGFMARDMTFRNNAGPEKQQAVALRANADLAIFFRCLFDGYQGTLYAHSHRQFYRDCDIRGTVDFIFGNAAAVFQNCTIRPRQPLPGQTNTITAQGKSDPNQSTGVSVQGCTVAAPGNVTAPTFLGRPWRAYSTAVFMKTEIGGVVDPKGWVPWNGEKEPPPTIFYGEYKNTGPRSSAAGRVRWAGYRADLSDQEAHRFAAGPFIKGNEWIQQRGVPCLLN